MTPSELPPREPITINGEAPNAHNLLAALIDIYDDEQSAPPEHRCYVADAWPDIVREARTFLASSAGTPPAIAAGEPTPVKYGDADDEVCPFCKRGPDLASSAGTPHGAREPAQLPESMSRDEMLKYYSEYANMQSNEALRYQKRIRDLEAALKAREPADAKDAARVPMTQCGWVDADPPSPARLVINPRRVAGPGAPSPRR